MLKRVVMKRRAFLRSASLAAGVVTLAACTASPPPAPTKAPQPAPAASPGAPASPPVTTVPAPTAAPSAPPADAQATAVPTKAPAPTQPPTAATAVPTKPAAAAKPAEQKIGKALIGKLEGPEVITDRAKFPRELKEPPQLADQVKAGKLPPVKDRIGEDPLVVKPLQEIGKYGGTWRRGFSGPGDKWNGYRAATGPDHVLFWDYTGEKIVPNIAKAWELSKDGLTTTVYLRKGMRWSDGQPFTADDFVFWFEDMLSNKELVPTLPVAATINGKPVTLEKVDANTIRIKCPEPYFLLPDILAGLGPWAGQANQGVSAYGSFAPAHYLKQFHPKYLAKDDLDKKVKDAKFDNWVSYFKFRNDWALNTELPVVTPWVTTTPANTPTWTLERNPYSIWVDTEGNQLPYIDKIVMGIAENLEVINLRAIAGEYDFQARHLDLSKLPVFLENQQKGNYKMYLDPGDYGADMMILINGSYEADPEIGKWFNSTDFRRALSLGMDREQINEAFWLGTGTISSVVPVDTNKYHPGPQYRTLWSTYDPKKANEMLDKVGLDKKDAEGYRLRSDGKGRLRFEIATYGGQFLPFTQISEMIREQWKKIGVDLIVQEIERSLGDKRGSANELQFHAWNNDGTEHLFNEPQRLFPHDRGNSMGPLYGLWFQTSGKQGKEPPPRMREMMEKWIRAFSVPEAERIKLGQEIWKIAADEVYNIGVIGLGAASQGVRVAKVNMGNVPSRQYNSPEAKNPSASRAMTFFWK